MKSSDKYVIAVAVLAALAFVFFEGSQWEETRIKEASAYRLGNHILSMQVMQSCGGLSKKAFSECVRNVKSDLLQRYGLMD